MPRLGLATIDISALGGSGDTVTTIDDFFFESFSAGEINPMLTTSRTNLVTHSEDFTNAFYQKIRSSVDPNQIISPDGTQNADKFVEDSSNDTHLLWTQDVTVAVGSTITWSVHAKKGERSWIFLRDTQAGSFTALFDLENGVTGNKIGSLTSNIEDAGNGWYRCSITYTSTTTTARGRIYTSIADNTNSYQGDGTSGVYIWGAQLEQDLSATAYIPTSGSTVTVSTTLNDTSEVWDFDGTDIMLEADPEDEGFWEEGSNLVLNHDYADLGSEKITGFTNGSVYAFDTLTTSGNNITSAIVSSAFAGAVSNSISVASGEVYKVTFDYTKSSGDDLRVVFSSVATGAGSQISNSELISTSGTYTKYFTITSTATGYLQIGTGNSGHSLNASIENISVKKVDPNDRWTLGTGWTISDGKAHADTSATAALSQTISTGAGNTYEVTFNISNFATGVLQPQFDGILATPTQINSDGPHTVKITAAGSSHGLLLYAIGTSEFSIDNVTVREYAVQPKDI